MSFQAPDVPERMHFFPYTKSEIFGRTTDTAGFPVGDTIDQQY